MGGGDALLPVEPVFLKSLRDHVYSLVRDAILSGRLKGGEKLNERHLASQLGISTTPLKEALRVLEAEGLVRSEPRRGIYITFNAGQAEEMMLARAALESMIARQAAKRVKDEDVALMRELIVEMRAGLETVDVLQLIALNERFHNVIHEASGCSYLRRLQGGQNIYTHAARLSVLSEERERFLAVEEHEAIANAIAAREPDLAERLMRDHVIRSGEKHLLRV
ncbi:DNA-binding GntR family transcriptional regulator [Neorhizobium sp. 2083]|uniref:GntR family transcriptional regulator n=1 Tax=Neorhizobium sp. 2083 TaxID=2817762 RepID=UPI002857F4BC|nr:GntR family transcriptional regulator [Neorhizobium sp. 2083]MDR6818162.1 DNA-binding GntR family transcriptional regulator [Neorhizobium sp. 2083]